MKKTITAITLLLALALLAGCGQVYRPAPMDQPRYTITDGAYDVTPDQLVEDLRAAMDTVKTIDFIPEDIPTPSETETDVLGDYRLIIIPRQLFLDLDTADDGRVSSITVRWSGATRDSDNAALIILCLLRMFVPTDIDKTTQDVDYSVVDRTDLIIEQDGTKLFYFYSEKYGNSLSLKPAAE